MLTCGSGRRTLAGVLLAFALLAGCGSEARSTARPGGATESAPPAEARPLVIFVRVEPSSIATRPFSSKGAGLRIPLRMFNGLLTLTDAGGQARPELLVSLPQLNTESWQVFTDGTMRTTYTLRPNLTWHDGNPLTADDFVFAWSVYSHPSLSVANQQPMAAISEVAALDRERFVINWKTLYPEADTLSEYGLELPALPQHILGPAFERIATGGPEAFVTHSFWGPQYVGLGPYRLQGWEPGAFVDATRFESYVLGTPKVSRIRLRFGADQNVVVASLLSGEAHVATENSIGQAAQTLSQEWARTRAGSVFQWPNSWRHMFFQLRADTVNPRALLDARVRKAIAHAVDKHAVSEAVYDGQAIFADTPVWSGSAWGAALDSSVPTYPLDLRASEALMNEAGFGKGADGFYRAGDGRLALELMTTDDPDNVREILVIANSMQTAGFDAQQRVIPAALAQDAQTRATFPSLHIANSGSAESVLRGLASDQIPGPNNRWVGTNRGGWINAEYDRLLPALNTTLDHAERMLVLRQMLRVFGEDVPSVSLFFRAQPFASVVELKGPAVAAPESNLAWNIYEWEFK
jgi:peptide/nickel transport system substrate-binding protein